MKTLKLSTLCAFLLILSSCAKDLDTVSSSTSSSLSTSSDNVSFSTVANNNGNGGEKGGNGGNDGVGATEATVNEKKPVLTPSQSPVPYTIGSGGQVTITYTATDPLDPNTQVPCGRISIYQMVNGTWTAVAHAAAPVASYTFTPTDATDCAYEFRAGFDPGGNPTQCRGAYSGVDYLAESTFCADVKAPCVQSFDIQKSVSAIDNNDGTFTFTVNFILKSPIDVQGVKFQGGATSGGQFKHGLMEESLKGLQVLHNNNQNTVLYWAGDLTACQAKEFSFSYKRKYDCSETDAVITGEWTAKQGETLLADPVQLTYSCTQ